MAGGSIDYVLNLKADGTAATGEIGNLKSEVGGLDSLVSGVAPAALIAGIGLAITETADLQTEIAQTSTLLDISAEDASRLTGALAKVGVPAEDVAVFALDIAAGLQGADDVLGRLKLSTEDVADPMDAVKIAIDNWDLLTPVERIELFGESAALQLGKLATGGQTATDILNDIPDARIFTDEQLAAGTEFNDNLTEVKLTMQSIINQSTSELIPVLGDVLGVAGEIGGKIEEWENDQSIFGEVFKIFWEQTAINIVGKQIEYMGKAFGWLGEQIGLNTEPALGKLGEGWDEATADRTVTITPEADPYATFLANKYLDAAARDREARIYGRYIPDPRFGSGQPGGSGYQPFPNQTNVTLNYGRAITPGQFADAAAAYSFSNGGNPI